MRDTAGPKRTELSPKTRKTTRRERLTNSETLRTTPIDSGSKHSSRHELVEDGAADVDDPMTGIQSARAWRSQGDMRGRKRYRQVLSEGETAVARQRIPRKEIAMSENESTTEDDAYKSFEPN